jgi:aspartyl-tRNA(Asn)/glutamyl-tRNA(Gln) amidotransferase subunit A
VRPPHGRPDAGLDGDVRVIVMNDPFLAEAADEIIAARDGVAVRLRDAGHEVVEMESPISLEDLCELQGHTTVYELARVHAGLLEFPENQVGAALRQSVIDGNEIDDAVYQSERRQIAAMCVTFMDAVKPTDLVLWPAAPTTAPEGLEWTGDRRFIAPWTALGGPVVSMPSGLGAGDMPIGMLLVGAPGYDRYVARVAPRLAEAVPQTV